MAPEHSREADENTLSKKPSRAWETLRPELSAWIQLAVSSMGFDRMTPVQASCIPLFMGHKDVIVEAVTGSGKTLAFLIPIIEKVLRVHERTKRHHIASIIISPTTELARQIYNVLSSLLAFHSPSAAIIRSRGEPDHPSGERESEETKVAYDIKTPVVLPQLVVASEISPAADLSFFMEHSPNLLIATPGRLLELLKSPHVQCPQSSFEILVLDEADRLLDMGFKDDLQKIIGILPKQRRTGLYSATIGEAVDQIVRVGLRNPIKIAVKVRGMDGKDDKRVPASLQMKYLIRRASHKWPTISKILSTIDPYPTKVIIFLSTCAAVDYFQHVIPQILPRRDGQPFLLVPLHGRQQQKIRQKNFTKFADATLPAILLTTDVAARGLDIPQVDLVVQVDPPNDPRVFLHRCGRAGRAGRKGLSILLLQPGREEDYLPFLEIRKTPLSPFRPSEIDVSDGEAQDTQEKVRKFVLADRALHDKAQRGFVSWAKAYSKHQASSIFRLTDQDWEDLGNAWALLKLPKMPGELKDFQGDKSLGVKLDWRSYAYRDLVKEQVRLKKLAQDDERDPRAPLPVPNTDLKRAWSRKRDQQGERESRRAKRHKKREQEKWEKMTPSEREDHQELQDMIQQVKRKKLDEDQFAEFEGFDD